MEPPYSGHSVHWWPVRAALFQNIILFSATGPAVCTARYLTGAVRAPVLCNTALAVRRTSCRQGAYFASFHLLTGVIVPSGVFTSDPVNVMTSPPNEIFCVRTTPLKSGEADRSTFHVSTISASLTVYVP